MEKDQLIQDIKSALVPEIQSMIQAQILSQYPVGSPVGSPPGSATTDNQEHAHPVNPEGQCLLFTSSSLRCWTYLLLSQPTVED